MKPLQPTALQYATPVVNRRRWWSTRTTVVFLAGFSFVQVALAGGDGIKQLFVDFKLKLPPISQFYLDAADWWYHSFGWVVALALALLLPVGITLLRSVPKPGNEAAKWFLASSLIVLELSVVIAATTAARYLPIITLFEGISRSKR